MTDNHKKIITYSHWHEFEELKPHWDNLLRSSDADTLFLSWDWIDCWRRTLKKTPCPLIISIWDKEKLCAIAPLYRQDYRFFGILRYSALRVMGDKGIGSEYGCFITIKEQSEQLKQSLWHTLLARHDWDFIYISNLAGFTSGGKTLLKALRETNHKHYRTRDKQFSSTQLSNNPDDGLSKSLKQTIRSSRNQAARLGKLTLTRCNSEPEIKPGLELLFKLHNARWQNAGKAGSFERRPELVAFYRLFAPKALASGQLRLYTLHLNDTPLAAQYGYVYNNQFLAMQEGFAMDSPVKGAAHLLRHQVMMQCYQDKLTEYDFLGGHTHHKKRWQAKPKSGCDLLVIRSALKTLPLTIANIWPTGRFLQSID